MTPRRWLRRPLAGLVAAFVLAAGSPAYAGDNTAVAVNTKDGFDLFRLAFSVSRAAGDVVDDTNAAVAFASCTDCQTIAVAIQIVLVTGDPRVVTPENLALAVNYECNLCDTLATAYQFVLSTGGPVRFTEEGRHRLNAIRKALHELRDSGLTVVEIQQRVDALMDELRDVLRTELVPVGNGDDGTEGDDPEPASPSATPAPTGSAEPDPSASPSPSPSESAASPSPSEEPTP